MESIARMKNTIEMGESLLIYPEGEVNGTGRTAPFSDSIAKLAKLLKAPLYAARTAAISPAPNGTPCSGAARWKRR